MAFICESYSLYSMKCSIFLHLPIESQNCAGDRCFWIGVLVLSQTCFYSQCQEGSLNIGKRIDFSDYGMTGGIIMN